jgi:proline dehydrogenase
MPLTDDERTEIFARIGQLEGARTNEQSHHRRRSSDSGGGAKAFASILVIMTIIGGMSAIIRPIQQQIDFMSNKIDSLQVHAGDGHPGKVIAEVDRVIHRMHLHDEEAITMTVRINKLEQSVAVLTQQMLDGTKDRYYGKDALRDKEVIETKIEHLNEKITTLSEEYHGGLHTNRN